MKKVLTKGFIKIIMFSLYNILVCKVVNFTHFNNILVMF